MEITVKDFWDAYATMTSKQREQAKDALNKEGYQMNDGSINDKKGMNVFANEELKNVKLAISKHQEVMDLDDALTIKEVPTETSPRLKIIEDRLVSNNQELEKWKQISQEEEDADMTRVLNFTKDIVQALENRGNYLQGKIKLVSKEIKAQTKIQTSQNASADKEIEIGQDIFRVLYEVPEGGTGLIKELDTQDNDKLKHILLQVAHQDPKAKALLQDNTNNKSVVFRVQGKFVFLRNNDGRLRFAGSVYEIGEMRKILNKDTIRTIVQSFKRKPASRHNMQLDEALNIN